MSKEVKTFNFKSKSKWKGEIKYLNETAGNSNQIWDIDIL